MKQVILIHGAPYEKEFYNPEKPTPSNGCWLPWVQKQLSLKGLLCQALEFPRPYDPIYEEWLKVMEYISIDPETILVGHSCGGGFLIRYLSEHPEKLPGKVILVAPWLDTDHELTTPFFNFEIDSQLTERTELHVLMSADDGPQLDSFKIVREKLPNAIFHEFTDKGHFTRSTIPEIMDLLQ